MPRNKQSFSTNKLFLLALAILVLVLAIYLSQKPPKPATTPTPTSLISTPSAKVKPLPAGRQATCNPDLWNYIWYPPRLKILTDCKTVTGTIEQKFLSEDGDYHLLLAPDHLVLEIICAGPTTNKTALAACAGYTNKVFIPNVGDQISVTGTYVFDTNHNWPEIHPVSVVEKL